jgi:hypothetical protein
VAAAADQRRRARVVQPGPVAARVRVKAVTPGAVVTADAFADAEGAGAGGVVQVDQSVVLEGQIAVCRVHSPCRRR